MAGPAKSDRVPHRKKYQSLHHRVRKARGSASEYRCACGKQAQEWANQTDRWNDLTDYVAMCRPCHRRYDARRKHDRQQDHLYDPASNGGEETRCRVCHNRRALQTYYRKKELSVTS